LPKHFHAFVSSSILLLLESSNFAQEIYSNRKWKTKLSLMISGNKGKTEQEGN